eukprot:PhF_6_TR36171/c0_g1_i1/m.52658
MKTVRSLFCPIDRKGGGLKPTLGIVPSCMRNLETMKNTWHRLCDAYGRILVITSVMSGRYPWKLRLWCLNVTVKTYLWRRCRGGFLLSRVRTVLSSSNTTVVHVTQRYSTQHTLASLTSDP